jgi:phosphatidylserine decarboxylase
MAIILVGAMLVASIATVWSGIVTPPQKQAIQQWSYENDTIYLKRGEEMGHFQLGSTVILLFANNMQWAEKLSANQVIQVGEAIGQITI